MTGKERMTRILKHEKTDRIGLYEHFWEDTQKVWTEQGHIKRGELMADHFSFDMDELWPFNLTADLHKKVEVIEETAETILLLDGNGALLRRHKLHDSTPEHVDFTVKDSTLWNERIKPMLKPTEDRINFEQYAAMKKHCEEQNRFFVWSGVNVFESIHPVCGHENFLVGMALEPEWVLDMANTYADLSINLMEILFSKCGKPDGVWYYEDMGYKLSPFMSPTMYRELIQPAHKKTIDYVHSLGLPVIMHSCGYVEPLLPYMVEAGIDCLEVIEIKAGMDLFRIHKQYGDKIALMGGIDVRTLDTNDKNQIDIELESKIPTVKQGYGYALHSDHSVPNTVEYDTFKYYIEKALELGKY